MTPMTMNSLIDSARVIPSLRARDLRRALVEMTRIASQAGSLDHDATCDAVIARGESLPFAFGRGVMIPHAMIAGLGRPLGVFARLDRGLDLDASDGVPIDLAFLILSDAGDESTLLRALACAARHLRDRNLAARLRAADGADAIYALLTSDAWRSSQALDRADAPRAHDLTNAPRWPTIAPSC